MALVLSRWERLFGKWILGPAFLTTYFWIVIQPSPATSHKYVLLCSDTNFLILENVVTTIFSSLTDLKPYLTDSCKFKLAFMLVPAEHLKCSVKGQDCRVAVPVLCWWLPVWERVQFWSVHLSICIIFLELPHSKLSYCDFNWCWSVCVYWALKEE